MEIKKAQWITPSQGMGDIAPIFRRTFQADKQICHAKLEITALGVYEAELNGQRIGDFVLAPGWTSYDNRLQVQTYDVTDLIESRNDLRVTVGKGWFRSPMPGWFDSEDKRRRMAQPCGMIAVLTITYDDGCQKTIATDEEWECGESPVRFSEIYDGETYDGRFVTTDWKKVSILDWNLDILIPQEGEIIRETECIPARQIFTTPNGEVMVDFGQEVTGYVEFSVNAQDGDAVSFNHSEVMDKDGNFYNENYRNAKAEVRYICRKGEQTYHPHLTFFGFRYIHLINWVGEAKPENFTAIAVSSDMKRTGWLRCGEPMLNKLFSNIVWGMRCNFLDVPTDCPQRDERLGWTGDAQVFSKTASYLYDVERFFTKWLHDMAADQHADGGIGQVIPDLMPDGFCSAAWGDAATICPWQIYQTYGNKKVLADQFDCMKKWVDYITQLTTTENMWTGSEHFGDWLGLDAPSDSYKGSSREDLIATAFYAHSVELVAKAGRLLGKDVSGYETLHSRIVSAFRKTYTEYKTQTEYTLAVHFGLAENPQKSADELAEMVVRDGVQLRTGFVGTPYLLHVLSNYGHSDLAWDLLLRKDYPGWLYPISKGATTIWEHWDGIKEDGSFWSADMNSFNHYAYGSVADWVFQQAAGICHDEAHPGFSEIIYQPHPDKHVGWLEAELETRNGRVCARWSYEGDFVRYELNTPVTARVRLNDEETVVKPGQYTFWKRA